MYYTQILTGNLGQLLKQAVLETIKRGEKSIKVQLTCCTFHWP